MNALVVFLLIILVGTDGFQCLWSGTEWSNMLQARRRRRRRSSSSSSRSRRTIMEAATSDSNNNIIHNDEALHPQPLDHFNQRKRFELKHQLKMWGKQTDRGFRATLNEQNKIRQIIFQLAEYNPTSAPAEAYFTTSTTASTSTSRQSDKYKIVSNSSSLEGKWTLLFTDAPDITSLKSPWNNPFTELARIGQECNPPTITNVIEWKVPEWIQSNPFIPNFWKGRSSTTTSEQPRILLKVVTKGKATREAPSKVYLELIGLKIESPSSQVLSDSNDFMTILSQNGFLAGSLQLFPISLQGPLSAPFGEFEVLYLDEEMRITRTGQNYVTINLKNNLENEWF